MDENEFHFEWFSGTGAGGQHRNKHQNCCRVTHKETGIKAIGTSSKSRESNRKNALAVCRSRVLQSMESDTPRHQAGFERVRTYHQPDNRVVDHESGHTQTYKDVVEKGDISDMIDARLKAKSLI